MLPAEVTAALPAALDPAAVSAYALVRCALDSPLGESHLIAASDRVVVVTRPSPFEPFRVVELAEHGVRYEHEAFSRTLTLKTADGAEHRIDVSILDVASVEAFVAAIGGGAAKPERAAPSPALGPISSPLGPTSSPFGPSSSPFGSAPWAPPPGLEPRPIAPLVASLAIDDAELRVHRAELVTVLAARAARAAPEPERAPKPAALARTEKKKTPKKPSSSGGWKPKPIRARKDELDAQLRAAAAGEPEAPLATPDGSSAPLFQRGHLIALLVGIPVLWIVAQLVARMVVGR